jgi:hypothetical protein
MRPGLRHLVTVLKNSPHGVHTEPRDLRVEGSLWLPQRHDEGAKSLPVEAKYGRGLHGAEPEAEVQATPTGIKTSFSRNVRADDNSVLTQRLSAGSDVGRRNRAVRECAEGRGSQAGKHYPFEGSPSAVDDSAARDGPCAAHQVSACWRVLNLAASVSGPTTKK